MGTHKKAFTLEMSMHMREVSIPKMDIEGMVSTLEMATWLSGETFDCTLAEVPAYSLSVSEITQCHLSVGTEAPGLVELVHVTFLPNCNYFGSKMSMCLVKILS